MTNLLEIPRNALFVEAVTYRGASNEEMRHQLTKIAEAASLNDLLTFLEIPGIHVSRENMNEVRRHLIGVYVNRQAHTIREVLKAIG